MQSAQRRPPLKQNNLMGTGNGFSQHQKFNSSLNDKGWAQHSQLSDSRGMLDAQSNYGDSVSGSNMFHPHLRDSNLTTV